MIKYLISTTEKYRMNNEEEALKFIEESKNDNRYILSRYSSQKKEIKQKGEVIDEYVVVTLTKLFNAEKEPEDRIEVDYSKESAF